MNAWGLLIIAAAVAVAVLATMTAAGARRTVTSEVALQAQRDREEIVLVAIRADELAAKGHRFPGTDAVVEYEEQHHENLITFARLGNP